MRTRVSVLCVHTMRLGIQVALSRIGKTAAVSRGSYLAGERRLRATLVSGFMPVLCPAHFYLPIARYRSRPARETRRNRVRSLSMQRARDGRER